MWSPVHLVSLFVRGVLRFLAPRRILLVEAPVASVLDLAKYILEQRGQMTTKKLQKLVYYSQAWSLVWSNEPLFADRVRAWREGPVVGTLYHEHRGAMMIAAAGFAPGDSAKLTEAQRRTIDAVLGFYGHRDADDLSKMTHDEQPWLAARVGLGDDDRGDVEITRDAMRSYYATLADSPSGPASPALLSRIRQGIDEAQAGQVVSRGSFAEYLED